MICTRTWRGVCLAFICCVCAPLARTRTYPAGEFHLGFTEFNNEYGTDRHNSPGLVFNFGYNMARNLRLVADFGSPQITKNSVTRLRERRSPASAGGA